ncbi:MAG: WD40 repeat domain-containing protein [Microcoleaceae cyanobacterium]
MKSLQTLVGGIVLSAAAIATFTGIIYGVNHLGGRLFGDESLFCPKGTLNSLVMTPDGKTLITGGKQIKLWDTATGKKLHDTATLRDTVAKKAGIFSSVSDLVVTPDRQTLISATYSLGSIGGPGKYEIQVWDLASREQIRTLRGHADLIRFLVVSPDSRTLVSQDNSGVIQVWELSTGQVKKTLNTQAQQRFPLVVSPDGGVFAGMDKDGTVKIWEIATGNQIGSMKADPSHTPLAISAGNKTLLLQNAGDVKRFREIATGAELQTLRGSYIEYPFARTPNGKQVLIQTEGGLGLYDLITGAEIKAFNNTEPYNEIDISPNGKSFLTIDSRGNYTLWDLATGAKVHQLEGKSGWGDHAFTSDVKILVNGNRAGNDITVWDLNTGKRIRRFCNR